MLEESARVVSATGNQAVVALVRSEACGSCGARSICHPTAEGAMQMQVGNPIGARPGDNVVVTLPPEALLKASAMAYMFPAVTAVAGAAIGWSRTGTDAGAMAGAGLGLLVAFIALFIHGRRKKETGGPVISRVVEGGGLPDNGTDQ